MPNLSKAPEGAECDEVDLDDFIIGTSTDGSRALFGAKAYALNFTNTWHKWHVLGKALAPYSAAGDEGTAAKLKGGAFSINTTTVTQGDAVSMTRCMARLASRWCPCPCHHTHTTTRHSL